MINKIRNTIYYPKVILSIGLLITIIGALESLKAWSYSPFLWLHASLCFLIPIIFPNKKIIAKTNSKKFLKSGLIIALICISVYLLSYYMLSQVNWIEELPWFNLWHTMQNLFSLYVERHGQLYTYISALFLLAIWAPIGEELFYRKYLYLGIREHWGVFIAICISSSLFGLRHALQLVYFLPDGYPWLSGIAYFIWAGMFGVLFSWLYERSKSISVVIILHCLNLIWAPFALYFLIYA